MISTSKKSAPCSATPRIETQWEIRPEVPCFHLNLRSVWAYRDLLWLLVRRDLAAFYKQTIFGPLWFFIQPLLTSFVFVFIFGQVAGISTNGLPQPLFYLAGIVLWNYFADCITKTATIFKDNASIFGKVYFPRIIMPLSIVFSNLTKMGVQFVLLLAFWIFYRWQGADIHPNLYILLFPVLLVLMASLGLGSGLIIAALTAKYRDLAFLISFGIQLLMYSTTVAYPLSAAPAKYRWLIEANPMTAVMEASRLGFLGRGSFSWPLLSYSSGVILFILVCGILIFNKIEKNVVDNV